MHNQVSKCLCQSVELNQKAREIDYAISVTVLRVEEEYCFPTATACEKGESPLQGTLRTEPCEFLPIPSSRRCVPFGSQTMPSLVSKSCRATKAVCGCWTSRVRIISVFSWFVLRLVPEIGPLRWWSSFVSVSHVQKISVPTDPLESRHDLKIDLEEIAKSPQHFSRLWTDVDKGLRSRRQVTHNITRSEKIQTIGNLFFHINFQFLQLWKNAIETWPCVNLELPDSRRWHPLVRHTTIWKSTHTSLKKRNGRGPRGDSPELSPIEEIFNVIKGRIRRSLWKIPIWFLVLDELSKINLDWIQKEYVSCWVHLKQ